MSDHKDYRADIDGLRAVAVMSVILCHVGNSWFQGGFLGVDVFFVISGYLIIGKLHTDICVGRFSLREFYIRRLRRLFPAMLATVLLCYLLFAPLMPPPDFRQQAQSSAFAIASLANVYFYLKTGYFDTAAVFKPLLHLWSLGVEEQFYFAMPVVVLALLRWARVLFWPLLALCALASLIGAELVYDRDPSLVYFMLPFRAFELMIGGLIHPLAVRLKPRGVAAEGLFALGLALIAVAVFAMDETTRIPGIAALVPCLGAALTIWTGAEALIARRLLTSAPVLWIGMISYSLYLVHWPAVSFWRYLTSQEWTALDQAGVILASLAAAAVMHRFVETPFRHMPEGASSDGWRANRRFLVCCALVAGLGAAPGVAERFLVGHDWEDLSGIAAFEGVTRAPAMRQVTVPITGGAMLVHRYTAAAPTSSVLLAGDSHAAVLSRALARFLPGMGVSLDASVMPGCPPLLHTFAKSPAPTDAAREAECRARNAGLAKLVEAEGYDTVILAARWLNTTAPTLETETGVSLRSAWMRPSDAPEGGESLAESRAVLEAYLRSTLAMVRGVGARVVLVEQAPPPGRELGRCLHVIDLEVSGGRCRGLDKAGQEMRAAWLHALFSSFAASDPGVTVLRPYEAFCAGETCLESTEDGRLLYLDEHHLSEYGAVWFVSWAMRQAAFRAALRRHLWCDLARFPGPAEQH